MPGEAIYDKSTKQHINVARLKKANEKFEIDIDPDLAMAFKQGSNIDIHQVLKAPFIFKDVKKGEVASEKTMQSTFKTIDPLEVAKIIIKEGEIQLTTEYRERKREEKKKQILNIIHRNGADPKTHLPHPMTRLELAWEQAKIHIDDNKRAEDQVNDILSKLRPILPIRFEMKEIAVKIPSDFAAKSYSLMHGFGKILNEEWQRDGSLVIVLEIAGGLEQDFYDKLNNFTHGNNETKLLKVK